MSSGFYEGLEWTVSDKAVVIGRGQDACLALAEPTISRRHAEVSFDGKDLVVRDLGSTNGILVNGVREERASHADRDTHQMGTLVLTNRKGDSARKGDPARKGNSAT